MRKGYHPCENLVPPLDTIKEKILFCFLLGSEHDENTADNVVHFVDDEQTEGVHQDVDWRGLPCC